MKLFFKPENTKSKTSFLISATISSFLLLMSSLFLINSTKVLDNSNNIIVAQQNLESNERENKSQQLTNNYFNRVSKLIESKALQNSVTIRYFIKNDEETLDYYDDYYYIFNVGKHSDEEFYYEIFKNDEGDGSFIAGSGTVIYFKNLNKYLVLTCKHIFVNPSDFSKDSSNVIEEIKKKKSRIELIRLYKNSDNEENKLVLNLSLKKIGEGNVDLCLLNIENIETEELDKIFNRDIVISDSDSYEVNSPVYHIGSYFYELHHSYARGHVAFKYRQIDLMGFDNKFEFLSDQYNLLVMPGSSGGGVFLENTTELVGVVFAGNLSSISFSIPLRTIKQFVKDVN